MAKRQGKGSRALELALLYEQARLGVELAELVEKRMAEWTQFTVFKNDPVHEKAREILKVKEG